MNEYQIPKIHLLWLSIIVILANTQGVIYINYYFPGTILIAMGHIAWSLKDKCHMDKIEIVKWITIVPVTYWIIQWTMVITQVGVFLPLGFFSFVGIVMLGILSKRMSLPNKWYTYVLFVMLMLMVIIFDRVSTMQGMQGAQQILNGEELKGVFVNRFFNSLRDIMLIVVTLLITKFRKMNEIGDVKI